MILKWEAEWYELDQTIIVGDIDYFYLEKNRNVFATTSLEDREIRAEIKKITHKELGNVIGILTIGLTYKVFLENGQVIQVDAEENIGCVEYPEDVKVYDWVFEVEVNVLEVTGYSSQERLNSMDKIEQKRLNTERAERYKRLLEIDFI
ncbi:hypothetical protein J2S09_005156 [Bacillus fengqiuensis]|nr:hypothetical protein [Bacillus fengqiuensis]